jgi:hypothetical protein
MLQSGFEPEARPREGREFARYSTGADAAARIRTEESLAGRLRSKEVPYLAWLPRHW